MNKREIVEAFFDAENDRDWYEWAERLDPNVRYEVVGRTVPITGREEYIRHMQHVYAELPDWKFHVLHMAESADAVLAELDGCGHFVGEYEGCKYDRVYIQLQAVCVFEFTNQRIALVREYWDPSGFGRQLASRG